MGIFEGAQMPRASLWKGFGFSQLEEPQKEPEQIPLVDTGTGCFQRSRYILSCIFRHLNPSKSLTLSV